MRFPTILPAVLLSAPVLAGAQTENPSPASTKNVVEQPWHRGRCHARVFRQQ